MDLSTISGPTVSIVTALAALPLAKLAERGKESRLRKSIADNLETITEIDKTGPTNKEQLVEKIEEILSKQINFLDKIEDDHLREKRRNWATLALAVFFAGLLTTPLWFMWRPEHWYTWSIFIAISAVVGITLIGGLNACFNPELNKKKETV